MFTGLHWIRIYARIPCKVCVITQYNFAYGRMAMSWQPNFLGLMGLPYFPSYGGSAGAVSIGSLSWSVATRFRSSRESVIVGSGVWKVPPFFALKSFCRRLLSGPSRQLGLYGMRVLWVTGWGAGWRYFWRPTSFAESSFVLSADFSRKTITRQPNAVFM